MTAVDRAGERVGGLPRLSPLTGVAALIVALSFVATGTTVGLVAGGVVTLGVFVLSAPAWFVLGQVALAGLVPASFEPTTVIAEGGLLLGFATAMADERDVRAGIELVVVSVVGLALGWGAYRLWDSLWGAMVVLGGVFALAVYGLYRYEQVRLGLVDAEGRS